jgi:pimeloyl-ACP methyl ester carboxylesterase
MMVDYPIALDSNYAIWGAFDNHFWPALYIADEHGRIRYHHFGEGEYAMSEMVLQQLLGQAGKEGFDPALVSVEPQGTEVAAGWSDLRTPETAVDLPAEQTAVMAATQRPIAELAFSEPNGEPAWKKLPSWAVVASGDKAAGADVVRSMAERAGAKITEVEGSHVIMVSQPQVVVEAILSALAAAPQKEVERGAR